MEAIYEGKAKIVRTTDQPGVLIQHFKDSATAFNAQKKAELPGKGRLNNRISSLIFRALADKGIPSHFIEWVNDRDMRIVRLDMIPLEVVVRNQIAGSLAKRTGLDEGTNLDLPILETYYKVDELGDPLLNRYHVRALKLATEAELNECERIGLAVNDVLCNLMAAVGITVIDFKLELGRTPDGTVLLGDEISPDTCRFWDAETKQRMDKDVFRRDLADLVETYTEVYRRLSQKFPQYDVDKTA